MLRMVLVISIILRHMDTFCQAMYIVVICTWYKVIQYLVTKRHTLPRLWTKRTYGNVD